MTEVRLELGSNISSRMSVLEHALRMIASDYPVVRVSSIVESPDVTGGPTTFANRLVDIDTDLPVGTLRMRLKSLEAHFGERTPLTPAPTMGCATHIPLDIDVVTYGSLLLKPDDLTRPYYRAILEQGLFDC